MPRKHRNIKVTIEMRLDAQDIPPEKLEKLEERLRANAKKSAYEAGIMYRAAVVTLEVGPALPVPETMEELKNTRM